MIERRHVLLAAVFAVVAVTATLLWSRPSGAKGTALAKRQQAMEELGARIAKLRPKCQVLVLANPFRKDAGYFDEKSQFERAGLRGLRQGLGGHSSVTVTCPEIRPDYLASPQSVVIPPDFGTPLSFLISPDSVDQLAQAHPQSAVIVSLIGLPADVDRLQVWREDDPRCFALLLPDLRVLGPPTAAVAAFRRGKLLAAVVEDRQTGSPLVVTRDNVVDVLKRQPDALGY